MQSYNHDCGDRCTFGISRGNWCLVRSHSGAHGLRAGVRNRQELKRTVMHPSTTAPKRLRLSACALLSATPHDFEIWGRTPPRRRPICDDVAAQLIRRFRHSTTSKAGYRGVHRFIVESLFM